jgi:hypothetical protein
VGDGRVGRGQSGPGRGQGEGEGRSRRGISQSWGQGRVVLGKRQSMAGAMEWREGEKAWQVRKMVGENAEQGRRQGR